MVLVQLKDPLELFVKSREFLPGSGFLSRHDMTYTHTYIYIYIYMDRYIDRYVHIYRVCVCIVRKTVSTCPH